MANPSGPSKQELLDVAKQAVAEGCSIQPEDVRVDEDGFIKVDHSPDATCPLLISVDDENIPCFKFEAILLREIQASAKLYRHVNEINQDLIVGRVYYEEDCIFYDYRLPTRAPSPQLITWLIRNICMLIDEYDDKLQRSLGGLRMADESLEELMLRDIDEASNDCNRIMMETIASYLSEEEISEYAESDDNDKAHVLEQLDLMLHCGLDQFQEYFRGYYGTPDNNFHGELLEQGVVSMSQNEFFEQLNWQEILMLCRRHCHPEVIASRFLALTGANYSSERERFPIQPWDGKPAWPMINGQYVASE
jgi:hypothetical protein